MDFSTIKDSALLVLMFVVFGAPALALAARLAIRPMLDAIGHMRENSAIQPLAADPRLAALQAEVARLSLDVRRLSESEAFTRQLLQALAHEAPQPIANPQIQAADHTAHHGGV